MYQNTEPLKIKNSGLLLFNDGIYKEEKNGSFHSLRKISSLDETNGSLSALLPVGENKINNNRSKDIKMTFSILNWILSYAREYFKSYPEKTVMPLYALKRNSRGKVNHNRVKEFEEFDIFSPLVDEEENIKEITDLPVVFRESELIFEIYVSSFPVGKGGGVPVPETLFSSKEPHSILYIDDVNEEVNVDSLQVFDYIPDHLNREFFDTSGDELKEIKDKNILDKENYISLPMITLSNESITVDGQKVENNSLDIQESNILFKGNYNIPRLNHSDLNKFFKNVKRDNKRLENINEVKKEVSQDKLEPVKDELPVVNDNVSKDNSLKEKEVETVINNQTTKNFIPEDDDEVDMETVEVLEDENGNLLTQEQIAKLSLEDGNNIEIQEVVEEGNQVDETVEIENQSSAPDIDEIISDDETSEENTVNTTNDDKATDSVNENKETDIIDETDIDMKAHEGAVSINGNLDSLEVESVPAENQKTEKKIEKKKKAKGELKSNSIENTNEDKIEKKWHVSKGKEAEI